MAARSSPARPPTTTKASRVPEMKICLVLLAALPLLAQDEAPKQPSAAALAVSGAGSSVQAATAPAVGRRRAPERVKGPTPHLADGTVDLSGVWQGGGPVGDIAQGMPKGAVIPMN